MHNQTRLTLIPSINRRIVLLAFALVVVAGVFSATAMVRDGSEQQSKPSAPVISNAGLQIGQLEQTVRDRPDDGVALTKLASAYVQRARETGDPSFYPLAATAVQRALVVQPDDPQTLIVDGGLALSRHDFNGALALAQRVQMLAPSVVATYAVLTDALVELGRYDEATIAAQHLADLHPDFAAYSRISYLRELHGDLDGAIEAMLQAVTAGSAVKQDTVWARVLVGNLYLMKNDVDRAETQYTAAAAILPDDPQTRFGLAKLEIARGDLAPAESDLREAIDQRPLPEYVIALGDLLAAEGRNAAADQQFALVHAEETLFASNGVDTDVELALFDADHGASPDETYELAAAAYARRPSIYAADTLAWAAFKAGHIDVATRNIADARRLGTRDPRLAYHAGMIERAAGDAAAAKIDLVVALSAAPALPLPYVGAGREALAALD